MIRILSLVLIGSVFALSACKKKSSKGDFGLDKSETIRLRIISEPPTLDWHKASDVTSGLITTNIMDGLVEYDYRGGEVNLAPALAVEWKSTNGAKTWEFKIREGVKWSDGQPFEPQHILDGWERLLNPMTASRYAYFLYGIKNARAYNEGKLKDFSKVGASVNGNTVKVELDKAMQFPYLLTHQSTFPARKDIVNKYGDKWTEAENMVSLGAYRLTKWDHDKAVVLQRNDSYYGTLSRTKNVIFYVVQEDMTALNLFDAGKLDALRTLPSKELPSLRKNKGYVEYPQLSIYYYGFNTKKPPTDNVLVRKALAHAIDRSEITKMLQGGQIPLSGWTPFGMFGHDPEVGLAFDPVRAKEYLKEAGYDDNNPLPKLSISFNTLEDHKRIAENVQAQLKRNLGVTVEINNEEWKVFLESVKVDPTHMYRMGWVADYPDPHNFFDLMTSYSDNNHTKWGNAEFDTIVETAVALVEDKSKRLELYKRAHKILVEEDVPVFPMYTYVQHHLVSDRLISFPKNVMFKFPLKNVSIQ